MNVAYDNVSYSYGPHAALKKVSCEFVTGRTALVVGHNGSGKSTFLKMMNGILKPGIGRVLLGETVTDSRPTSELARHCALSFQNPDDQLFAQSVEKELRFGIDNIGGDGRLFDDTVRILHLEEHLKANPYSLTYALRRLVAIGGSAVMGTPVLALDEPTAGLSVREKEYLGSLISLLKKKGTTVVIVTHDLNFLLPFADDLLVLSRGEAQYAGKRDDLFADRRVRDILKCSGIRYPVYARISAGIGMEERLFSAEEIVAAMKKKRAGTTRRTNGQHQLEGA